MLRPDWGEYLDATQGAGLADSRLACDASRQSGTGIDDSQVDLFLGDSVLERDIAQLATAIDDRSGYASGPLPACVDREEGRGVVVAQVGETVHLQPAVLHEADESTYVSLAVYLGEEAASADGEIACGVADETADTLAGTGDAAVYGDVADRYGVLRDTG